MISVLIPWHPDGGWREMLSSWIGARYAAMGYKVGSASMPTVEPKGEVLWGEDSRADREPFSAAAALNEAFERSTGSVVFLVGADTVPDPIVIRRAMKAIAAGHPWVTPWQRTLFAVEKRTARLMDDASVPETYRLSALDIAQRLSPGNVVDMCAGPTICTRAAWERVGGQDERFRGWGPEDQAFRMRLERVYGPPCAIDVAPALHLWHPVREWSKELAEAAAKDACFRVWEESYEAGAASEQQLDEAIRVCVAARTERLKCSR